MPFIYLCTKDCCSGSTVDLKNRLPFMNLLWYYVFVPIVRPKTRWEDDVLEGIKSINIGNGKKVAQNRDSWKKVVEQARTLYRL